MKSELRLFVNLFPYLLGLFAVLSRLVYVVCCACHSLLSKTHVEIVLDTVAATRDLVPDTPGMAFIERLNEVCAVLQLALTDQMWMHDC